jgi:hypothetical protein
VVEACGKLTCETALIDGEMVVQDEHGITDFHAARSAIYTALHRIVFFAFDLLRLNSQDLRGHPLIERRALLRDLVKPGKHSPLQFSAIISKAMAPGSMDRQRRRSLSFPRCRSAAFLDPGDLSQSPVGIGSSMPMAWRWLMCTASRLTPSPSRTSG